MIKTLLKTLCISAIAINCYAGEIKLNIPLFVHHTEERKGNLEWNEKLTGKSIGASYSTNKDFYGNQFGGSITYANKNSYGDPSFYITGDYQNEIWSDGPIALNLGAHIGMATGYTKKVDHGRIPFGGVSAELEAGNISFMTMITPPYKKTPATLIGAVRFKLGEF